MSKADELKKIYQELEANVAKLPLATKELDIVPGEGSVDAQLLFIGEAPGFNEAVQRRPFVGRSGQLLRQTISQVGFPPENVYITNIVKVRPPENRDPLPQEILAFKPYLDREIEVIAPKMVVTLGRFSMAKFLPEVKISQVHGRLHQVKFKDKLIFVLPFYHPAAALRSTKMKQSFVEDCQKLPKIIDWLATQADTVQLQQAVSAALF